jgi:steroid 5-alpha reductase family enzyme
MSGLELWPWGLAATLPLGVLAWAVATMRRNAGLVDIFWSIFFAAAAAAYLAMTPAAGERAWLVLALVVVWSVRLAAYLAARNWGAPEDHRYRAIRARNDPGFAWKSLYLVFGLQAVLAWAISAPLAAAIASVGGLGWTDGAGAALAAFGIAFEAVADAQLARFRAEPRNRGQVMERGLWRYSRHPNYFGEFCVWWGLWILAAGAGGAWTAFAPLLMSFLLLRVSGVALLEKDIGERRPAYVNYRLRTNAFFPGPRRGA